MKVENKKYALLNKNYSSFGVGKVYVCTLYSQLEERFWTEECWLEIDEMLSSD